MSRMTQGCFAALVAMLLVACNPEPAKPENERRAANLRPAGQSSAAEAVTQEGDPERGIPPCSVCHGQDGEGNAGAGFPRIAALPAPYLEHQLRAFANGERKDPAMTPIAEKLDASDRQALAVHYSRQRAPVLSVPAPDPQRDARGQMLALHGDPGSGIPACSACHGWNGGGDAPDVPWLAGQHATYLRNTLVDWQTGERDSDPRRQMPEIARRLSGEDVVALASWFSRMPPPRPNPYVEPR